NAAATWFARAARVREATARLETVLLYGAALGRAGLGFDVAQLPHGPSERWVGLAPLTGPVPGGRLSLVAKRSAGFDAAESLAELRAVDEDTLRGTGQFLPAAYFAANESGDTVSTDFARNAVEVRRRRR